MPTASIVMVKHQHVNHAILTMELPIGTALSVTMPTATIVMGKHQHVNHAILDMA
jgi:hypothetical protein